MYNCEALLQKVLPNLTVPIGKKLEELLPNLTPILNVFMLLPMTSYEAGSSHSNSNYHHQLLVSHSGRWSHLSTSLKKKKAYLLYQKAIKDFVTKMHIGERVILWYFCGGGFSVAKLCPTLQSQGLQHARLPCPSRSPGVDSCSCALNH